MSAFTKAVLNKLSQFSAHLDARLDAQDAKIDAALKAASPPSPEPFEPWQRPQIDLLARAAPVNHAAVALGDQFIRDVVRDNSRAGNVHVPRPIIPTPQTSAAEVKRGSGWQDEKPLRPPPGISQLDKIMDVVDQQDRQQLLDRAIKTAKWAKDLPPSKRDPAEVALDEMPLPGAKP